MKKKSIVKRLKMIEKLLESDTYKFLDEYDVDCFRKCTFTYGNITVELPIELAETNNMVQIFAGDMAECIEEEL